MVRYQKNPSKTFQGVGKGRARKGRRTLKIIEINKNQFKGWGGVGEGEGRRASKIIKIDQIYFKGWDVEGREEEESIRNHRNPSKLFQGVGWGRRVG